MRKIVMKLTSRGSATIDTSDLVFSNENLSVLVEVVYPKEYHDYNKIIEVETAGVKTFRSDMFVLTSNILKHGEVSLQATAMKEEEVQKWEVKQFNVRSSLNIIDDTDIVDENVMRDILNLINDKSTDVDNKLLEYAKTVDVNTKLKEYATNNSVDTKLEKYAKKEHTHEIDDITELREELRKAQVVKQLDNLIVNGDFSDGTVGWKGYGSTISVDNGYLVANSNALAVTPISETKTKANNKYYIRAVVKQDNIDKLRSFRLILGLSFANPYLEALNVGNEDTVVSGILETVTDEIRIRFYFDYTEVGQYKAYIKSPTLLNLTQIFGAGNEPSKEFCDSIMEVVGYFNGQYDLTTQEMFEVIAKCSQKDNGIMTLPLNNERND